METINELLDELKTTELNLFAFAAATAREQAEAIKNDCPDCKSELIHASGCRYCALCGWSDCA